MEVILSMIMSVLVLYFMFKGQLLNLKGTLTALGIFISLGLLGGILWIITLLCFLDISYIATFFKLDLKKEIFSRIGKKEDKRGPLNVLANGLVPSSLALIYFVNPTQFAPSKVWIFLMITAFSASAADTLASEIGILSSEVYLITSLKRTKPGIDGGISFLGTAFAFFGSTLMMFLGAITFYILASKTFPSIWLMTGIIGGFLNSQIDSLLGATVERKGFIGNSTVNFLSIFLTVLLVGGTIMMW